MNKNTNDGNQLNSLLLLSKLFCVFLFFFVQNFHSQIFISEGAIIHVEKDVLISQTDSLVSNNHKNKIYISSGVTISNLDTRNNFEIVEHISSENKKKESAKDLAANLNQTQEEEKVEQKTVAVKTPDFSKETISIPKTEEYFSFGSVHSKISVPVSQFNPKQIFFSVKTTLFLSFKWHRLAFDYSYIIEPVSTTDKSSFSVRPPPSII